MRENFVDEDSQQQRNGEMHKMLRGTRDDSYRSEDNQDVVGLMS